MAGWATRWERLKCTLVRMSLGSAIGLEERILPVFPLGSLNPELTLTACSLANETSSLAPLS